MSFVRVIRRNSRVGLGLVLMAVCGHAAARGYVAWTSQSRPPVTIDREGRYFVPLRGDEPSRGSPQALVTIIEFASFQCGHCARAAAPLEHAIEEFSEDVRVVFKHYPQNRAEHGFASAYAGVAAMRQSKFWPFAQAMFDRGGGLDDLRELVSEMGMDPTQFWSDMNSDEARRAVDDDRLQGAKLGLTGTRPFWSTGMCTVETGRSRIGARS